MSSLKKMIKRLFFYSSRQLYRRKRSYATIFVTSVVLLSLVMTFLELAESYYLKDIEQAQSGYHHASIRGLTNDLTEDIYTHPRIESVFTIPYTSLMASSDDTSRPARITTETAEIDDYLDVRYLWGSPPEDGEIAVSVDLYRAYGYLEAGAENDMFFSASDMTYFPLTISGIFDCNDSEAGYAFVSENTSKQIDRETGAKIKYDHYIRCKNSSERYIAMVVSDLFDQFRIPDTDWQQRQPSSGNLTESGRALEIYDEYINSVYLEYTLSQEVAPTITISMPIIIIAALMMASFMSNWMTANAAEYGILGAIGANRRQLCTISAGQILLIGLAASIPVVLFSSLISNIYISAYNAASGSDVDFIYSVPWSKLIQAALWWNVLACFFSYIGIARLTMEQPFVLISGSFRSRMPFVKRSDYKLSRKKDKIRRLSFIRSLRQVKSGVLSAVITSFICIVCGVFVFLLVIYKSSVSGILTSLERYSSDMIVSVSEDSTMYNRTAWITEDNIKLLEETDGIADVGYLRYIEPPRMRINGKEKEQNFHTYSVCEINEKTMADFAARDSLARVSIDSFVVDETALELMTEFVVEGDVNDLFTKENQVILTMKEWDGVTYSVGDKIVLSGEQTFTYNSGRLTSYEFLNQTEFTVAAIISRNTELHEIKMLNDYPFFFLLTSDGASQIGVSAEPEYDTAMIWFEEGVSEEEMVEISENIAATPAFMRFDLLNISMQTDSEKRIEMSTTLMLCFFFAMLYFSFCTMTFVDSSLKVTKMRNEIAVLRQVGADDKSIYKSLRCETYLVSAIGLILSVVVFIVIAMYYLLSASSALTIRADYFGPLYYPPELVAHQRQQIYKQTLMILAVLLPVVPLHLISAGITILGTIPPIKRLLKETITEGLRKDTD